MREGKREGGGGKERGGGEIEIDSEIQSNIFSPPYSPSLTNSNAVLETYFVS